MRDETVLAFDFGVKRIGVAIGERRLGQARALLIIADTANAPRFSTIGKLIAEWQATRLIVGRPLNEDGSSHEMTMRCERFAHQLKGRFGLPLNLVDERFSSLEADLQMRESNSRNAARGIATWQQRKAKMDAEAARIILQSWFDSAPSTTPLDAHELT